jgi:hypothetical protein
MSRESFVRLRRYAAAILVTAMLAGAILGIPASAAADCVSRQPSLWIVILFWECTAKFTPSTSRIDAAIHQEYGAPWCYIKDRLQVMTYQNYRWVWQQDVTWENWQSVDSFNHFGVHRTLSRGYVYNGTYRVIGESYRLSNHNQLLYAGYTAFAHTPDNHTLWINGKL